MLVGHGAGVGAVEWVDAPASAGGPRLLTGCDDGSVGCWDMAGGLRNVVQAHGAPVKLVRQVRFILVVLALNIVRSIKQVSC